MSYNDAVIGQTLKRIVSFVSLLAAILTASAAPAMAETVTVLVIPFVNQTGDRNLDWLGEGLSELIVDRLSDERELYVFNRDERLAALERMGMPEKVALTRATVMKLGWDVGADIVIVGSVSGKREDFGIEARAIDLQRSSAGDALKASGKLADVIPLMASLGSRVAKTLVPGSLVPVSDYTASPPIPPSAFEDYVRGLLTENSTRRIELLRNAVRLDPQYTAAIYQLGLAYHSDRNFKSSSEWLEKVGSGQRESIQARFFRGLNAYHLGDYASAISLLSALPETYDVLIDLGAAKASKGDFEGAYKAWMRASEMNPFGADAHFNLGFWKVSRGEDAAAVRDLEQFLKLEGRDGEGMFLLGRAYERLGRLEDSRRTTARAVEISPRIERWLTEPLHDLQRLSSRLDQTESRLPPGKTLWNASRLARRASGHGIEEWIGSIQTNIDSQLYGVALGEIQELLRVFPASSEAHLALGQAYEGQKNYEAAIREYERAIDLTPTAESYLFAARAYRTLNRLPLALEAVNEALKIDPGHAAASTLKAELERSSNSRRRRL